jgi:hypothetical protein
MAVAPPKNPAREKAKRRGLKRYFDGKRCPSGHLSAKLVSNYTCIECLHQKYFAKRRVRRAVAKKRRAADRAALHGGHHLPASAAEARALGIKRYFTGKECLSGHMAPRYTNGRCVECQKISSANRDALKERARKAKSARDNRTDAKRAAERHRRATNSQLRSASIIRSRIKRALKGHAKSGSALTYLGCSIEHARKHIERQFLPGMTWENHSLRGWHIDHVRPIATFDLADEDQRRQAFHYTNLQPLWAVDNLAKGKRLLIKPPEKSRDLGASE